MIFSWSYYRFGSGTRTYESRVSLQAPRSFSDNGAYSLTMTTFLSNSHTDLRMHAQMVIATYCNGPVIVISFLNNCVMPGPEG